MEEVDRRYVEAMAGAAAHQNLVDNGMFFGGGNQIKKRPRTRTRERANTLHVGGASVHSAMMSSMLTSTALKNSRAYGR